MIFGNDECIVVLLLTENQVKGIEQVEDEALNKVNEEELNSLEKRLQAAGIPID